MLMRPHKTCFHARIIKNIMGKIQKVNSLPTEVLHVFCSLLIFFSKSTFSENSLRYTIRVSNSLDPDQG